MNFQGKFYSKLEAEIRKNSNYEDDEFYQYYFINIYGNSKHIASTYPDDTIFEKFDIVGDFSARTFEEVNEDAPNFFPDAHKTPAQISEIDEIALNFFDKVSSFSFKKKRCSYCVF